MKNGTRKTLTAEDKVMITQLYVEYGKEAGEIANLVGCSRGAVYNCLNAKGITLHQPAKSEAIKAAHREKNAPPVIIEQPPKSNEELFALRILQNQEIIIDLLQRLIDNN